MARSQRMRLEGLPAALLLVLSGCAKAPVATGPSLAPAHNVYLRTSFDTDPSDYLSRFLPQNLSELDESSGMTLACSKHITWLFIDGDGVQTVEVLHASSSSRTRLGTSLVEDAAAGSSHARAVRVDYTLTGKSG